MTIRLVLPVLFLVALGVVFAVWQGFRRWQAETARVVGQLVGGAQPGTVETVSMAELEALPPPVSHYLRQVLPEGQGMIRRARVTWEGEFNLGKPGADHWKPFAATQDYVVDPAGFVWSARIAGLPGLPILIRDGFVAGQGSMVGKLAGLLTVVDRAGTPEIAAAALQRHLGETIWFPTAFLPSQGVVWTAIDDSRALATLSSGGVTTSVEFRFGPDGLVASAFVPDRIFDDGKQPPAPLPWQARNLRWGRIQGLLVPTESVAEWLFPTGPFAYWKGGPTAIEFELVER